jgi:hypothetical protein
VRHDNIVFHGVLKRLPWVVVERAEEKHEANRDPRALTAKPHLIALVLAQLFGLRSLREIETNLRSHAGKLYHLGGKAISRSTLATANASGVRAEVFTAALTALIDSTSVRLNSLSEDWATFSAGVCGAKAHIIYDPDADQPLYLMVTASNVNDITAAKTMPIEPGATYVFDLGYYDYAWWAKLDDAGCRIVTRLKANTPFSVIEERPVTPGSSIISDRIGHLPPRLAASRRNPMAGPAREITVVIDTGKVLRIFTNDLRASAEKIAALYKRRWHIELFFRWVKHTLKITRFLGTSENAVRVQIIAALIAFLLLRLTHEANKIVPGPLAFARLIRANLLHRRPIAELLQATPPPSLGSQPMFAFGEFATRAAHRRRASRACAPIRSAA